MPLTPKELGARLRKLRADLNAVITEAEAPAVPPPPPPAPAPTRPGLYVDFTGRLRTKAGAPVVLRGVEVNGTGAAPPARLLAAVKALGANTVSPLFHTTDLGHVKEFLDAARTEGLVVGVNADHIADGREWLCQSEVAALVGAFDNVFLQCEVETGWRPEGVEAEAWEKSWAPAVTAMVLAFRKAGYRCPVKVGSPDGGRSPRIPLKYGSGVLAADPEHNVLFTWQAYWTNAPKPGWHYQQHNDVPTTAADPTGAVEMCRRLADSGLHFVIGLDLQDDVGETLWRQAAAEAKARGLSWQWWVLHNDFRSANQAYTSWDLKEMTDTGRLLQTLFADSPHPVSL